MLKTKTNIPQWDLSDLYDSPSSKKFKVDMAALEQAVKQFSSIYEGKIIGDNKEVTKIANRIADCINAYEDILNILGKISAYATLYHVTNTNDPERTKFYGDTISKITNLSKDIIFFELELNQLSDGLVEDILKTEFLKNYKTWFRNIRKYKPHQLSTEIEQLFQEKSMTSYSAWNRLFDQTVSNMKIDIESERVSLEVALNMLLSSNENQRRDAFLGVSSKLKENISLFTHIMNTICQDKSISDKWRKYNTAEQSRHLANNIESEVIDTLVDSVEKSYHKTSHRYYQLKAKLLDKEYLESWDRNAPLPEASQDPIPWNEAKDIVISSYEEFSPDIAIIVKKFFDNNWIDAQISEGKVTGAFAHPVTTDTHPYILMNYQGKPRDVMTLAHELGHGVHQVLASKLGPLLSDTPLTLAETASVFGEMLTFQKLLGKTENDQERKVLIASKIEDMINTVVRQISFYKFERLVHTNRANGELTSDNINALWLETQENSLGPGIKFHEQYKYLWAYIPHFIHSPFYVYAYAFGDCLVNSLYAIYEKEPKNFVKKYIDLLSAGGSKHHTNLLEPFSLDANKNDFWDAGISLIIRMIDELETLS